MYALDSPVVMTTGILLVTLCLVAMATSVTSQCSQFPNATRAKSLELSPSIQVGENIGLIAGIGVLALLISLLFIAVR